MRLFRIYIYIVIVVVLETTLFSRLRIFGVSPDLLLVSVIIISVLGKRNRAIALAGFGGLLQDILSFGFYLNTVTKVIISVIVNNMKENYSGNENSLIWLAVLLFTPAVLLIQSLLLVLFFSKEISLFFVLKTIVVQTIYNLLFVPLLLFLINRFVYEQ